METADLRNLDDKFCHVLKRSLNTFELFITRVTSALSVKSQGISEL